MTPHAAAGLVDRAVAERPLVDEPSLMAAAMRLGRGHYHPGAVLDEIRRRDLFSSQCATWSLAAGETVRGWWRP